MEGLEAGGGRQSRRISGSLQKHSPANAFASPPSPVLASRTTALILKEDKSHPEPSADSNLNKKIYPSATRVTLFLLLLLLCLEKQTETIMEKSPAVWVIAAIPRGLGKIQRTAGNSCCEINCNWEGRRKKEDEFIVYYTRSHSGLRKAGFYFLSQTKSFFSLLPYVSPPNEGSSNRFPAPRQVSRVGYHPHHASPTIGGKQESIRGVAVKAKYCRLERNSKKQMSPGNMSLLKSARKIAPGKEEFHSPHMIMTL